MNIHPSKRWGEPGDWGAHQDLKLVNKSYLVVCIQMLRDQEAAMLNRLSSEFDIRWQHREEECHLLICYPKRCTL